MSAPVCPPHGTYWHYQYGWDVLSNVPQVARLALAGGATLAAVLTLDGSESIPLRALAVVWIGATAQLIARFVTSGIAQTIRSKHTIYRLRDFELRVIYVGRTTDWVERFEAHTEPDAVADEPWRRYIDDVNSGPCHWCLTPWGEWASERFRIRQAATLARWKLAPKVHNNQLNRPYRSPMLVVAVFVWLLESLWFGKKRTPESDNLEHDTGHAFDGEWAEDDPDEPAQPDTVSGTANVDSETDRQGERAMFVASYVRPSERPIVPSHGVPDPSIRDTIWDSSPLGEHPDVACPTPGHQEGQDGANDTRPNSAAPQPADTPDEAGRNSAGGGAGGSVLPFAVGADGACERLSEGAAGGGRACLECDRPRAEGKPRCVDHHRKFERDRKANLRKASA